MHATETRHLSHRAAGTTQAARAARATGTTGTIGTARATLIALAIGGLISPPALAQLEEVIVTAQKRQESVQDVPIAVTAFDSDLLEAKQVAGFGDIRFTAPSVSYVKGNFTGNNFAIRGVGTNLVATSADSGVGIHVNEVPLQNPRLFETEYYDINQLSVLRGPQGTLYGRNSTGGAVNMDTAKAEIGEAFGNIEGQYGDFDHNKVVGHINIPMSDTFAARLAAINLHRDGYTENVLTGNSVDGRDQYSLRASFKWLPTEDTSVDLMLSHFNEDSTRSRSQKTMCDYDPSGVLGCLPTHELDFNLPNQAAQLSNILASTQVLGPLGAFDLTELPQLDTPHDLRKVASERDPTYDAHERLATLNITHEMGDYTLAFVGGYHDTEVDATADYQWFENQEVTLNPALPLLFPKTAALFRDDDGNSCFPMSAPADNPTGVIGGHVDSCLNSFEAYDRSRLANKLYSGEWRVQSNFDGKVNFLAGVFYMDSRSDSDYWVVATGLDYLAALQVPATAFAAAAANEGVMAAAGQASQAAAAAAIAEATAEGRPMEEIEAAGTAAGQFAALLAIGDALRNGYTTTDENGMETMVPPPLPLVDGIGVVSPAFNSETRRYAIESRALFGELYLDIDDTTKLTLGLRYTVDKKEVSARAPLYAGGLQPIGTDQPVLQPYDDQDDEWEEFTGRAVLDWSLSEDSLAYVSLARGYKGGGINPPFNKAEFPNQQETFDPEFVNALEFGLKNTLLDNTLQANLSAFFYDYKDLQVSRIVNRTSFNENTDADIYGAEAELVWAPDNHLLMNANLSYVHSEVKNFSSVDTRDPAAGRDPLINMLSGFDISVPEEEQVTTIKALDNASNCVVMLPPEQYAALVTPEGETPDPNNRFSSCDTLRMNLGQAGVEVVDGIEQSLGGNQLQNSPEFSVSLGAQYTWDFGRASTLALRLDYYWQDDMYSRIYNRPVDRIESWDVFNAQFILTGAEERWYARAYIKNLRDDNNVVGHYLTDASSGNFTNVFVIEPRTYGLAVGYNF